MNAGATTTAFLADIRSTLLLDHEQARSAPTAADQHHAGDWAGRSMRRIAAPDLTTALVTLTITGSAAESGRQGTTARSAACALTAKVPMLPVHRHWRRPHHAHPIFAICCVIALAAIIRAGMTTCVPGEPAPGADPRAELDRRRRHNREAET